MFRELVRNKSSCLQRLEMLRDFTNDIMTKKFGRRVSIQKLESIVVNKEYEERKQEQHDLNVSYAAEMDQWKVRNFEENDLMTCFAQI